MRRFIEKYNLGDRTNVSRQMIESYPSRVPIICEPSSNCNIDISEYTKVKYLVPRDTTIGKFLLIIRMQLQLTSVTAMYMFVNNTLPPTSALIGEVYDKHKHEDGFLYITFTGENFFG